MGKVMPRVTLTNEVDRDEARRGMAVAVRTVDIDALVDTGATMLALPADVVLALGLPASGTRVVRFADGRREEVPRVGPLRLEILGRDTICEALVLPAGTPALIGQIPLEALDLVVDPKNRELRVNPESPDAPLLDLLVVE